MTLTVTVNGMIGTVDGYLTSYQYAEKHGLKEGTIRRWIYAGKLAAVQISNSWWIKEDMPPPPKICNLKEKERKEYMKTHKLNPKYFRSIS